MRRRAAAKALATAPGTDEVRALLVALVRKYLRPADLLAALKRAPPEDRADKAEAIWKEYAAAPHPRIGLLLAQLGWPPARQVPPELARGVLDLAAEDAPPGIQQAAVAIAHAVPHSDEPTNDALCAAWGRTRLPELKPIALDGRRRIGQTGCVALAGMLGAPGLDEDDSLIVTRLRQLDSSVDGETVEALWACLASQPSAALAAVVAELGWPPLRPVPAKLAHDLLGLAADDAEAEILAAATVLARALPPDDEALNDRLYGAWVRTQASELESLIIEQARQPATPALEALFALASGQLARYAALEDRNGDLLVEAFALAPETCRVRVARTIAASPDRLLKLAYRRALRSSAVDAVRSAENLALVGDEDGLFEQTRHLTLLQLLAVCERWATSKARPSQPRYRAAVERAVEAFRALGEVEGERGPELPDGMVDLFDYWRAEAPPDAELRADLEDEDPFYTARGLYLGRERGLVDADRIARAAKSAHWLLRLVGRLLDPIAITEAKSDHVVYVNACAADAQLLTTVVGGTPDDYDRSLAGIRDASGPGAPREQALLRLSSIFQAVFVSGGITVDDTDAAVDGHAIEVENADDGQPR